MIDPLLAHARWADAQAFASIETLPGDGEARSAALRLYAHMAAAAHVWLSRLEGRRPVHPVWPDLSPDVARALADESLAGLQALATREAGSLDRAITYRTSAGQPFTNTVGDVLLQVILHGQHHRGQVALLVRQGGGTPAMADYIFYRRDPAQALPK